MATKKPKKPQNGVQGVDTDAERVTLRIRALNALAKMKAIEAKKAQSMVEWQYDKRTVIRASPQRLAEMKEMFEAQS